jgi:hypothetical protein
MVWIIWVIPAVPIIIAGVLIATGLDIIRGYVVDDNVVWPAILAIVQHIDITGNIVYVYLRVLDGFVLVVKDAHTAIALDIGREIVW